MNNSSGVYAIVDRRVTGEPRVVARFNDPREGQAARDGLRAAGDRGVEVRVVPAAVLEHEGK